MKKQLILPEGREAFCPVCGGSCELWYRLARLRWSTRELKQIMKRFHLPTCAICQLNEVLVAGDTCERCHPHKIFDKKNEPTHVYPNRGALRSAGMGWLFKGW
jgi:hypothetical protein